MLIVVGGHTRNIGKTSVVAGLIAAIPEVRWTAIKITQFGHGVCSADGDACACTVADPEHPFAISEETGAPGGTDTSRFLAAGAERAYWVRTAAGQLGYAVTALRRIFAASPHVIVESNSILQFFKPELYFAVMDFAVADFKATSLQDLDRADALILTGDRAGRPAWTGVSPRLWDTKPRFYVQPPQWVTEDIAACVRGKLNSSSASTAPGVSSESFSLPGDGK
jgi:hypothetical protein